MTTLQALLLGITEGITEFLPISSTGHLILVQDLLGVPVSEVTKSFDIVIQLGAILAAVVLYAKKLMQNARLCRTVLIAFIPTAIIGALFHSLVKEYLLGNVSVVLVSLFLGGIILIAFEYFHDEKPATQGQLESITPMQALLIGIAQSIALIPGVSRSAATILGGMMLGLKRGAIVEFSFLLAIPTMFGATALDLFKSAELFSAHDVGSLLIGFTTAFVTALVAIKWLLRFIQSHSFIGFGMYRIAVTLMLWFFLY